MNISKLRQRACKHAGDHRHSAGQTLVEYGLLIALIAIVVIIVVSALGGSVTEQFSDINSGLDGETGTVPPAGPAPLAIENITVGTIVPDMGRGYFDLTMFVSGGEPTYYFSLDSMDGNSGWSGAAIHESTDTSWTVNTWVPCDGSPHTITTSLNDDGPEPRVFQDVVVPAC